MSATVSKTTRLALKAAMLAMVASSIAAPIPALADSRDAPVKKKAKNVILFIGDGMGITTIAAARIYDGQSKGMSGEENQLSFEKFPEVALVKTYNTNQQVPDSAGTATAFSSGVKTRAGMLGVGPATHLGDCSEGLANIVPNIMEVAKGKGKKVGIVSTARITHATPASVYAHSAHRDWENDGSIPESEWGKGCVDIAKQLVNAPFDIALGGGRDHFFGKEKGGKRWAVDADLPAEWAQKTGGTFVDSKADLIAAKGSKKPVLGLFSPSHMTYTLDRKPDIAEPTLSEMTAAAIDHLKGKQGYYLMVEAGRIDHGNHAGRAGYALSETQELSRAVEVALSKVDLKDTLVMVTADHSHVLTFAGYATRGNPILGLSSGNDSRGEPTGKPDLAADGKPYTTLGYQNGPGAIRELPRKTPDVSSPTVMQQAAIPTGDEAPGGSITETHGGEDVALFATGAGADGAHGVIEQNKVFDIMLRAFGWKK